LIATYNKWLNIFPFEISFFANLKPHFEMQIPILKGKMEVNKYTGLASAKMHTKRSLIDVLLNHTNSLITQINTATLHKKGLLTEPQKIKLELILNERDMKIKKGYVNNSKSEEERYRKILKEWFSDEKRFIDEVAPFLKIFPPQQTETIKTDEVEKEMHLKIFVENAFNIWEQMFESFKINKKKRTDLSFMYEVMLYDKLIHKTVSKKNIEDWINETYQFAIDKIHYTDIKTRANEKRMATYNLLKQSK